MSIPSAVRARQGLIYILLGVTGYAFLPVFASYIRGDGLAPLDTVLWRYVISLPILWLMAARTIQQLKLRAAAGRKPLPRVKLFILGIILAVEGMAAFIGLQYLSPGIYLVLFYTYPAITAVLSTLLGDRLSGMGWLAVVLTMIGVALTATDFVSLSGGLNFDQNQLIGAFCALVNATLAAIYFIWLDRMMRGHSGTAHATAWMATGAVVFLGIISAARGLGAPQQVSTWVHLAALALVSTVMPLFMINKGIQSAGPTRAAIFGTIEPLLTAILALLILGETMQPVQWVGGVIVVASVILLQLRGSSEKVPAVEAAPAPIPATEG